MQLWLRSAVLLFLRSPTLARLLNRLLTLSKTEFAAD
jgi:hypothetical protein